MLKIINKEQIIRLGLHENVDKELKAFETLSKHENIIGFKGIFDDKFNYYFVLKYCPYGDLS